VVKISPEWVWAQSRLSPAVGLQNKWTNCKGVKNNTNFGQIIGIKEKLDTTYK